MNPLITTLLNCPNLSLRVLGPDGRTIKTLDQEQLRHFFNDRRQTCPQHCDNTACEIRQDHIS